MLRERVLVLMVLLLVSMAGLAQTCRDDIAASAPDIRFQDNLDGTVTDLATGLIWKQCAEGLSRTECSAGTASTFTWQQALQHAADNPPWRLPNRKELASLVETRCMDPSINSRFFPNTPSAGFWSSSPWSFLSSNAWRVMFTYGHVRTDRKYTQSYVRLMRGGQ